MAANHGDTMLVARCGELRCRLCGRRLGVREKVWSHLTVSARRYRAASNNTGATARNATESSGVKEDGSLAADERLVDIRKLELGKKAGNEAGCPRDTRIK